MISEGLFKRSPPCIIDPAANVEMIVKKNNIICVLEIFGEFIILYQSKKVLNEFYRLIFMNNNNY